MRYEKPEIVVCTSAVQAIQNSQKNSPVNLESDKEPTIFAAYEADE
jgi:hypothetical protein